MALVLSGGIIVTATEYYRGDVRIENQKITAIGKDISSTNDELIDVTGYYLLPGGIDVHTHFDLPVGTIVTADDFASGTKAAIMGGTTTIIDYATQFKGESLSSALQNWHNKANGKCYTDYAFHMAITDYNEYIAEEINDLSKHGVSSVKLYLAYKNILQADDNILFEVLQHCQNAGVLVCVHCENGDIIDNLVKQHLQQGHNKPKYHSVTRPVIAEWEAVNRVAAFAECTGAAVYIVHLSSSNALDIVAKAKAQGLSIYAETCPQYLLLDDSYYNDDFNSTKYVISPPLRSKDHQSKLWQGLKNNIIDTIATDHCAFNFKTQKFVGRNNFSLIPNGIPGVEHRLGLLYTYGVMQGKLNVNKFVALTSTNPAKIFGLFPRKGAITTGSDADIVVWNAHTMTTITAAKQHQKVDYTPYEGFNLYGRVEHVFLRGQHIVRQGKLYCDEAQGIYLARSKGGQLCLT